MYPARRAFERCARYMLAHDAPAGAADCFVIGVLIQEETEKTEGTDHTQRNRETEK